MNKVEPIKIGFPTNRQIAKDCAQVKELLELEPQCDGFLTSRFLPDTEIFPMRVRTIAEFLRNRMFQFGILGDDTAVDEMLDGTGDQTWPAGKPPTESLITFRPESPYEQEIIAPELKCFGFNKLPATKLSLLQREEMRTEWNGRAVATSYPNAAKKILWPNIPGNPASLFRKEEGQLEFLLRNFPDFYSSAVDIVRSGETAARFRLKPVKTLLISRPGIWRTPKKYPNSDTPIKIYEESRLTDIRNMLRERLQPLI